MVIEEIKEILFNAYDVEDSYDSQCGCYVNGYWLSLDAIIEILEKESV